MTDGVKGLIGSSPVVTDILYEEGAFIHAMPYRAGADQERTPLMHEIRRDGLDL